MLQGRGISYVCSQRFTDGEGGIMKREMGEGEDDGQKRKSGIIITRKK
jgi:hypothetical protein